MSALRCARNVITTFSRAFTQRGSIRSLSLARPTLVSRTTSVLNSAKFPRAFSVSSRVQGEGTTDVALVQKLQEELKYEKETEREETPEFLKQIQEEGIWTVNDVAGNDEVALVRKFGNEEIRVVFSIADITGPAYETAAEDEEGNEVENPDLPSSNPIHVSISITKSGINGAMNIDATCADGEFVLENVSFYNDTKIGTELTAEADWKRRGLYIGPNFQDLDPNVQEEFQSYLEERGINESLALFVPDYAEHKEQIEYVRWLESVKRFIEH